jgi:selenocysteine-specific elongation factor
LELLGRWGLPRLAGALLEELAGQGLITRRGGLCCLQEFRPALKPQLQMLHEQIVQEIAAGGFQPPSLAELRCAKGRNTAVVAELVALAVAEGKLVAIRSELHLAPDALGQLKDTVRRLVEQNGSVTVSELRMALGSTRKFVVPFCEYLDSIHFTRRIGEKRVLADAAKTA